VVLCRQLGLPAGGDVALDGSRFKTVNTRDRNFTPAAIRHRIKQVEASIARHLAALDTADRQEDAVTRVRKVRIAERLNTLRMRIG
jgi:transposase